MKSRFIPIEKTPANIRKLGFLGFPIYQRIRVWEARLQINNASYPHPQSFFIDNEPSRFPYFVFQIEHPEDYELWKTFINQLLLYSILEMIVHEQVYLFRFIDEHRILNGLTKDRVEGFRLQRGQGIHQQSHWFYQKVIGIIDSCQAPQQKGDNLKAIIKTLIRSYMEKTVYDYPRQEITALVFKEISQHSNWWNIQLKRIPNQKKYEGEYRIYAKPELLDKVRPMAHQQAMAINELIQGNTILADVKKRLGQLIDDEIFRYYDTN